MFFLHKEAPYRKLDKLAILAKTDKSSKTHNYTKIYAELFAPLRTAKIHFLEIGVQYGYSIHLWEKYFTKATLYFFDIDLSYLIYQPKRAKLFTVDQSSSDQLRKAMNTISAKLDIIIDDGGHQMKQQQVSFSTLFSYLSPGGMYIIEDLHTSYMSQYQDEKNIATSNYISHLIDKMHQNNATDIESITLYPKLAVIRKKALCISE